MDYHSSTGLDENQHYFPHSTRASSGPSDYYDKNDDYNNSDKDRSYHNQHLNSRVIPPPGRRTTSNLDRDDYFESPVHYETEAREEAQEEAEGYAANVYGHSNQHTRFYGRPFDPHYGNKDVSQWESVQTPDEFTPPSVLSPKKDQTPVTYGRMEEKTRAPFANISTTRSVARPSEIRGATSLNQLAPGSPLAKTNSPQDKRRIIREIKGKNGQGAKSRQTSTISDVRSEDKTVANSVQVSSDRNLLRRDDSQAGYDNDQVLYEVDQTSYNNGKSRYDNETIYSDQTSYNVSQSHYDRKSDYDPQNSPDQQSALNDAEFASVLQQVKTSLHEFKTANNDKEDISTQLFDMERRIWAVNISTILVSHSQIVNSKNSLLCRSMLEILTTIASNANYIHSQLLTKNAYNTILTEQLNILMKSISAINENVAKQLLNYIQQPITEVKDGLNLQQQSFNTAHQRLANNHEKLHNDIQTILAELKKREAVTILREIGGTMQKLGTEIDTLNAYNKNSSSGSIGKQLTVLLNGLNIIVGEGNKAEERLGKKIEDNFAQLTERLDRQREMDRQFMNTKSNDLSVRLAAIENKIERIGKATTTLNSNNPNGKNNITSGRAQSRSRPKSDQGGKSPASIYIGSEVIQRSNRPINKIVRNENAKTAHRVGFEVRQEGQKGQKGASSNMANERVIETDQEGQLINFSPYASTSPPLSPVKSPNSSITHSNPSGITPDISVLSIPITTDFRASSIREDITPRPPAKPLMFNNSTLDLEDSMSLDSGQTFTSQRNARSPTRMLSPVNPVISPKNMSKLRRKKIRQVEPVTSAGQI